MWTFHFPILDETTVQFIVRGYVHELGWGSSNWIYKQMWLRHLGESPYQCTWTPISRWYRPTFEQCTIHLSNPRQRLVSAKEFIHQLACFILMFYLIRGGRFWPKSGCDHSGHNCEVGQSVDPCLPTGCDPPAETKVEFFFPPVGDPYDVWYDVSLVDGYSLPAEIIPSVQQGSCVTTKCAVSLDHCPTNEEHVGDLRVIKNGRTVQCLAPCKSMFNHFYL